MFLNSLYHEVIYTVVTTRTSYQFEYHKMGKKKFSGDSDTTVTNFYSKSLSQY